MKDVTNIEKAALSPKEAAQYLGLSVPTLKRMRSQGVGINYVKNGKKNSRILYPIKELDKFLSNTKKTI
ncbi:MAG: helix-turn-helix domain-containing protein [Campylobacteraceae bacterium]|jgi:excisionase family DNA binding protein|nr:helix-turn-helix domain-containing protein [Campylobacteraceae bacterium]